MRPMLLAPIAALALACGSSATPGGDSGAAPGFDAAADAEPPRDAAPDAQDAAKDASGGPPDGGTYRNSLSVCWTDATCKRVMAIAHGGAWDASNKPYDSNAAIAEAYALGVDGVKIDVRVTKDNVPVISHSSPLQIYESLDCYNKKIEEMLAADVVKCHRFPSSTETFQRLDDVLNYLRGKMTTQLCVKLSSDYARTIQEIHALKAEDFAFIELGSASDLENVIPPISGSSTIWYLTNVGSNVADVDKILALKNPRAFMIELDPTVQVATITQNKLHPAGVRSFTYTSAPAATVADLKALFDGGYDVVSAQTAANDVQARVQVNQSRGVSPP